MKGKVIEVGKKKERIEVGIRLGEGVDEEEEGGVGLGVDWVVVGCVGVMVVVVGVFVVVLWERLWLESLLRCWCFFRWCRGCLVSFCVVVVVGAGSVVVVSVGVVFVVVCVVVVCGGDVFVVG